MSSIRFVVCTYNIWTNMRWPERAQALRRFTALHRPDILCLQELQAESRHVLDEVLSSTHRRVEDPFPGWTREGNIYWNEELFALDSYGAEPIDIIEEYRRLFWVRLRVQQAPHQTLFVSTAHYTWPGHVRERTSEQHLRIPSARKTLAELARLSYANEPVLFMGDLNDSDHVIRILTEGGLTDCFSALGRIQQPTSPAYPTSGGIPATIDWLFQRGPITAMQAGVIDFFDGDIAPSDHKPVMATYRL